MERLCTCQLREKVVVNICDGTTLGYPMDFEFDAKEGRITALVVPQTGSLFGFFRGEELIIPWCKIECIGEDNILVRLTAEEYRFGDGRKKRKRQRNL